MSKKNAKKKNLEKRLSTIIEIYMEQKGKAKRKKLAKFIREKIGEILLFRDNLSAKKMQQKKEAFVIDNGTKLQIPVLQPSPALSEELHKNANI